MPDQKSFIENKHPGFYMDKYGSSKLLAVEVWKDLQHEHGVMGSSIAEMALSVRTPSECRVCVMFFLITMLMTAFGEYHYPISVVNMTLGMTMLYKL